MANSVTQTRDIQGKAGPGGSTIVEVSDFQHATITLDTLNTAETSICVLNTTSWREAILLCNVSVLTAGANPNVIINVWNLDQSGNRYPKPGSAPANNGFVSKSFTAIGRTRDVLTSFAASMSPLGSTIEITFNTGTSGTSISATIDIEVQLKN